MCTWQLKAIRRIPWFFYCVQWHQNGRILRLSDNVSGNVFKVRKYLHSKPVYCKKIAWNFCAPIFFVILICLLIFLIKKAEGAMIVPDVNFLKFNIGSYGRFLWFKKWLFRKIWHEKLKGSKYSWFLSPFNSMNNVSTLQTTWLNPMQNWKIAKIWSAWLCTLLLTERQP